MNIGPCDTCLTLAPQESFILGLLLILSFNICFSQNPKTKEQIENLLRNGMNKELRDRLCCRMTFGTAGLRSAMGAGFCYINDLTVIQSTQVSITEYFMCTIYHTIFFALYLR